MIDRPHKSNNCDEVKETQERATGTERRPERVEETSLNGFAGESGKHLVNSSRRREIVEHAVSHLPWGATPEFRLRALRLARQKVMECGLEANELLIMKAANEAVEGVASECKQRQRKEELVRAATRFLPFGATDDDEARARKAACTVLDETPIDTPDYEVESGIRESLKPLIEEIKLRQRKRRLITDGASYVDRVLRDLLEEDLIGSEERWDGALRRRLAAAVRWELEEGLAGDETDDDLQAMVESIVEDELGIELSEDDEEDYAGTD